MPMSKEFLRQKFMEFDKSGDGKLTLEELQEHLSHLLKVQISLQAAKVSAVLFAYLLYFSSFMFQLIKFSSEWINK